MCADKTMFISIDVTPFNIYVYFYPQLYEFKSPCVYISNYSCKYKQFADYRKDEIEPIMRNNREMNLRIGPNLLYHSITQRLHITSGANVLLGR